MSRRNVSSDLNSSDEMELFRRVAEEDDLDARSELAEIYFNFAKRRAKHCYRQLNGSFPLDELESHAFHALIHFIDRFRPSEGVPFEAFASKSLVGEIKRLAYRERFDRLGPKDSRLRRLLLEAEVWLRQHLGREPTIEDLSRETGIDESSVKELMASPDLESIDSTENPMDDEPILLVHEPLVDRNPEFRTLAEVRLREVEESIRDFFQQLLDSPCCIGEEKSWIASMQRTMTNRVDLSEGALTRRLPPLDRRFFMAAISRVLLNTETTRKKHHGIESRAAHPRGGDALARRIFFRTLPKGYALLPIRGGSPGF